MDCRGRRREPVPGAEARIFGGLNVRVKTRTYLRSKSNGKNEQKQVQQQIPCGDDNEKSNSRIPAGMTKKRSESNGKKEKQEQRQSPFVRQYLGFFG